MTDEQEKALDQIMTANLARTIDFVKFAEAKNAALLTFASGWLLASATVALKPAAQAHAEVRLGLMVGGPFLAMAAITALRSFLPQINLRSLMQSRAETSNLLFFGDIARLEAAKAGDVMRTRYVASVPAGRRLSDDYFVDLGCQIAINSQIASRKYRQFSWAAFWLFVGLGVYLFSVANMFL